MKNNMENKTKGSVDAGSPIATSVPNPNSFEGATGETLPTDGTAPQPTPVDPKDLKDPVDPKDPKDPADPVDPKQHKELESLVGRQGEELGEYRKFFTDIAPLLDKLDKSPEIVQAIVDGNITADLAKAAMEGKVKIEDAQIVSKAHEEVKKELGKEGYKGASPDEVSKLVEDKAEEIKKEFDGKLKERDDLAAFEASVNEFIAKTEDFKEYASEIDKWLDEHDVTDIVVAYYAVKGELSEKEAKKQAEIDKIEAEKNLAGNLAGGTGNVTHIQGDENIVDSLIASKANPNLF